MIASAFSDLGFEVEVGALFATPAETAETAIAKDVDMIGLSTLAAGHLKIVPELKAELVKRGRGGIILIVGGVIPPEDYEALRRAGADAIFGPGTNIADAAELLVRRLAKNRNHVLDNIG